jgi:hypothetical protein
MNSNETGMIMQDRRQTAEPAALSPALVEQATQQLQREIHLIEGWLAELEGTSKDNPEALAARKAYSDMIQSRRDLLQTLQKKP